MYLKKCVFCGTKFSRAKFFNNQKISKIKETVHNNKAASEKKPTEKKMEKIFTESNSNVGGGKKARVE